MPLQIPLKLREVSHSELTLLHCVHIYPPKTYTILLEELSKSTKPTQVLYKQWTIPYSECKLLGSAVLNVPPSRPPVG